MPRTVWYPGHMAKGIKKLDEVVAFIDCFVEVVDARAPVLTESPFADKLREEKPVVTVMSKRDLADESATTSWLTWYKNKGVHSFAFDLRDASCASALIKDIRKNYSGKIRGRDMRVSIIGVPNVGKSLLLNNLAGKRVAKVGAIPGVTRSVTWFKREGFLLLDSPGILDHKKAPLFQRIMAILSSSKGEVISDAEGLASDLGLIMNHLGYIPFLKQRYGIEDLDSWTPDMLTLIASAKGCLKRGGEPDRERAGHMILEDFSKGRLGRMSLEFPDRLLETWITARE